MKDCPLESNAQRVARGPKPPCRTAKEFADEVGVSLQQMVQAIARDEAAPKPNLRSTKSLMHAPQNHYPLPALRRWWASRKKG